jgi:hypothetical protein
VLKQVYEYLAHSRMLEVGWTIDSNSFVFVMVLIVKGLQRLGNIA